MTVPFTPEQVAWIEAQAKRLDCSRPDVIRAAVERMLRDSDD
jgi:hypothetical protein